MYLSKLILNLRHSQVRRDVARVSEMHRTLMNSYPYPRVEHQCDLLFRVEPARTGPPVVLIQTRDAPVWTHLPDGYLVRPAECKPLDLLVAPGQRLRFRLRANPTKRIAAKNERLGAVMAGKRVGLVAEAEQVRWLLRKGEHSGFQLPGAWVDARNPAKPTSRSNSPTSAWT